MIHTWKRNTNERQKLQVVYAAVIIITVALAGIISLLNPTVGRDVLNVSFVAFCLLVFNTLTWALINMWIGYSDNGSRRTTTSATAAKTPASRTRKR